MPKKKKELQYYEAVGRRKEAVARVRLYIVGKTSTITVGTKKLSKGHVFINGSPMEEVYKNEIFRRRTVLPLKVTDNMDRFAVSVQVNGGGPNGQLEAIMHGISRALVLVEEATYKPQLKQVGLLTRDSRARQRRKVGTGGKARRQKQSPKR